MKVKARSDTASSEAAAGPGAAPVGGPGRGHRGLCPCCAEPRDPATVRALQLPSLRPRGRHRRAALHLQGLRGDVAVSAVVDLPGRPIPPSGGPHALLAAPPRPPPASRSLVPAGAGPFLPMRVHPQEESATPDYATSFLKRLPWLLLGEDKLSIASVSLCEGPKRPLSSGSSLRATLRGQVHRRPRSTDSLHHDNPFSFSTLSTSLKTNVFG